jgi:FLVCR family feline leukemia virus subgroup C receptor-related protein
MTPPTSPEKSGISVIPQDLKNGDSKNGLVVNGNGDESSTCQQPCRVYKYRWVVLILFVMYSLSNAFQWIQFAIINGLIVQFYDGISPNLVDMTSMIFMITYIPLIFPATYFLERYVSSKSIRFPYSIHYFLLY